MKLHHVSIVIPVYRGEHSIKALVEELALYFQPVKTPAGNHLVISELLLVHDPGPDRSDVVIEQLAQALRSILRRLMEAIMTKAFGEIIIRN